MPAPAFAGARKINGQVNLSSSSFLSKLPATLFQCASGASAAPAANQFVMRGAASAALRAPLLSRASRQSAQPTDRLASMGKWAWPRPHSPAGIEFARSNSRRRQKLSPSSLESGKIHGQFSGLIIHHRSRTRAEEQNFDKARRVNL